MITDDFYDLLKTAVAVIAIVAPIIKLTTTVTQLTEIVKKLTEDVGELTDRNSKTHARLFDGLDKHADQLADHETRITVLEHNEGGKT